MPPHSAAMSSSRCTRFSPKPGAWIAVTLRCPLTWLCTSICSAVPSTFSATMTSGFGSRMIFSSTGISSRTSVIFSAENRRYGSSRIGHHRARVGDQVRRDVAVVELEVLDEVDREARAPGRRRRRSRRRRRRCAGSGRRCCPIVLVVVGRDRRDAGEVLQAGRPGARPSDRCSTIAPTARSMPRLTSTGLPPEVIAFMPSWTIACAITVAVVVPSPTVSFVLTAASLRICAPMFSNGSRR